MYGDQWSPSLPSPLVLASLVPVPPPPPVTSFLALCQPYSWSPEQTLLSTWLLPQTC